MKQKEERMGKNRIMKQSKTSTNVLKKQETKLETVPFWVSLLWKYLLFSTIVCILLFIFGMLIGYFTTDFIGRSITSFGMIIAPFIISYNVFIKRLKQYQDKEYQDYLLRKKEGKLINRMVN